MCEAYADADYGWCAYCRQFSYHVITRGACGDCRARWDAYPMTAPRWYASDAQADAVYVVTTGSEPVAGRGSLDGLKRHSLREAREVYRLAMRAHMAPRIVHAVTLAVVTEAGVSLADVA